MSINTQAVTAARTFVNLLEEANANGVDLGANRAEGEALLRAMNAYVEAGARQAGANASRSRFLPQFRQQIEALRSQRASDTGTPAPAAGGVAPGLRTLDAQAQAAPAAAPASAPAAEESEAPAKQEVTLKITFSLE